MPNETTINLSAELKSRLLEAAQAEGYHIGSGRDSELPLFMTSLLDRPSPAQVGGETVDDVWASFMDAVGPLVGAFAEQMQQLGQRCTISLGEQDYLVSLSPADGGARARLAEPEGWTEAEFAALGRVLVQLLTRLFQGQPWWEREAHFASLEEANFVLEMLAEAVQLLRPWLPLDTRLFPRIEVEGLADALLPEDFGENQATDENIARARFVRRLDPDNADAHLALALLTGLEGEAKVRACQEATRAGARRLGNRPFEEPDFAWWGDLRSRPYMRARASLAWAYWENGRFDRAAHEFDELLRLNPNDNQDNRVPLTACLLEWAATAANPEEVLAWLRRTLYDLWWAQSEYVEDTFRLYACAAYIFLTEGEGRKANDALRRAFKQNIYVPTLFCLDLNDDLPGLADRLESYERRSQEEAIFFFTYFYRAWAKQPDMLDWFVRRANRSTLLQDERSGLYADPPRPVTAQVLEGFGPMRPGER